MGTSAPNCSEGGSQSAVHRKARPNFWIVGNEATSNDTIMPPSSSSVTMAESRAMPPKMTSPARLGAFCVVLPGGVDRAPSEVRGRSDMGADKPVSGCRMAYARRPERWPPGFIEAGRPAARIIQISCARCLLLLPAVAASRGLLGERLARCVLDLCLPLRLDFRHDRFRQRDVVQIVRSLAAVLECPV